MFDMLNEVPNENVQSKYRSVMYACLPGVTHILIITNTCICESLAVHISNPMQVGLQRLA